MDDSSYQFLFKPILSKVMQVYDPKAVVLQCGADSLSGDRLGCFNLSIKGHAECVKFMRSFNVPLLLLGGGGFTMRNVARCWCYETAVALNKEISNELPVNEYWQYYGPDFNLYVPPRDMENKNKMAELERMKAERLDTLSKLQHIPSVQFQERLPAAMMEEDEEQDTDDLDDSRLSKK